MDQITKIKDDLIKKCKNIVKEIRSPSHTDLEVKFSTQGSHETLHKLASTQHVPSR
jgi:hypothetical protein